MIRIKEKRELYAGYVSVPMIDKRFYMLQIPMYRYIIALIHRLGLPHALNNSDEICDKDGAPLILTCKSNQH